ncbi:hypothetical protein Arub01_48300 [Actinomadura rubrobrunea]|uniref:Uncharacterized protein n=1 Tax=Actinomadura rubrobrunea TaxID=115335 RepID=A0A9W6UWD6_9ACTN|nr:hypothetical protein Arub01_48300 [Actinomadura rubrobrunea]
MRRRKTAGPNSDLRTPGARAAGASCRLLIGPFGDRRGDIAAPRRPSSASSENTSKAKARRLTAGLHNNQTQTQGRALPPNNASTAPSGQPHAFNLNGCRPVAANSMAAPQANPVPAGAPSTVSEPK